jgi:ribosome recycling factor
MSYDFSELDTKINETKDWLTSEFDKIRTGRATATVLDDVTVDSYGTDTPISQLGSIGNEGPRTLRVDVYDASQIDAVEKALQQAEIGASISKDDSGLRLNFPELTAENREQAKARAKAKLEEAKISLRSERDDALKTIKELEADGEIAEDKKFRLKEQLEERIKTANQEMKQELAKKEEQLSQ